MVGSRLVVARGRAPVVGSPVPPVCSACPPLLLGLKSSCLTADSNSGAKRQPAAGQCRSRAPGAPGRPEMLHAPALASPFPSHLRQLGDVLHHGEEPSPAPSAWSAKPGTTGCPPGRGPRQRLLRSRSNAVPTTSDPSPFPAPAEALPPPDGDTGCSPLPRFCSEWAELAPHAPLAAPRSQPEPPQVRRL